MGLTLYYSVGDSSLRRFILTSAQNNTPIHRPFWRSLLTYAKHVEAQVIVGTYTYNLNAFSNRPDKKGKQNKEEVWFAKEIVPYIADKRIALAKSLAWCGEINIIPTATNPLSGLDTYAYGASAIFPHPKLTMKSLPREAKETIRANYTTGSVTRPNYIGKKEGYKAEFHHVIGALLVEIDDNGRWWVRQLNSDRSGGFYDVGIGNSGVYVTNGVVHPNRHAHAVVWGDLHTTEITDQDLRAHWGPDGLMDYLRPRYQFLHDVFSMGSQSHHDVKSFAAMFRKYSNNKHSVSKELKRCADVIQQCTRPWCETYVVHSNHDRHLDRWLDETDYRKDCTNAEFYLEAALEKTKAAAQRRPFNTLQWALEHYGVKNVWFLPADESFVLLSKYGGVDFGWHGDRGPNGSKGSVKSLSRLAKRITIGHFHSAEIYEGVYCVGAVPRKFDYATGPTSSSVSHCVVWPNGKRQIITVRNHKWRA